MEISNTGSGGGNTPTGSPSIKAKLSTKLSTSVLPLHTSTTQQPSLLQKPSILGQASQQPQKPQQSPQQQQKSVIFLNELSVLANWKREQTLGSGSFAIITLWLNTASSERIALKQFRNQASFVNEQSAYYNDQWKQEIEMMKRLKCDSVVKALDLPEAFASLKVDTPILAMEFCSGGDLRKVLNKPYNCCGLEEKEVRQILKQIGGAMEYLHSLKIIHRDLKPENIVLQPLAKGKTLYKLTDLGYAKQLSDCSLLANSFVGTLEYLAPELFLRVKYSSAVDNWSFGLLAYEVTTGRRPFLPNHSMGEILEVLKKRKSSQHICTEIDEQGNFYFSSEISQFNHICSRLKVDLEAWLRIVLEYDHNKRGGQQAFKSISDLMHKYVVQIFSLDTYETFSYEIEEGTTLDSLKRQLSVNTATPPTSHYLVLPNGEAAQEAIGAQIIRTWYRPASWFEQYNPVVLYVFDVSKPGGLEYLEFYKSLTLPSTVERMLLEPSRAMDYDEIKLTWRHCVWVARQSVKKYHILHSALKSALLTCINVYNRLQTRHHQLAASLTALFTSAQVLIGYLRFSVGQVRSMLMSESSAAASTKPLLEQPVTLGKSSSSSKLSSSSSSSPTNNHHHHLNNNHHSQNSESTLKATVDLCLKVATILKSIHMFRREKVRSLFERTASAVPSFSKEGTGSSANKTSTTATTTSSANPPGNFLFENFLKSADSGVDSTLMRRYNDILAAYDSLRKKKKEERRQATPNNQMVALLCDLFQQVETLMKGMFTILRSFTTFIKEVEALTREGEQLQAYIDKWTLTTGELHAESWAQLARCYRNNSGTSSQGAANSAASGGGSGGGGGSLSKATSSIHSKLLSLTMSSSANSSANASSSSPSSSSATSSNSNLPDLLRRQLETMDGLLKELEKGQADWAADSKKVDFRHLELYNLLF